MLSSKFPLEKPFCSSFLGHFSCFRRGCGDQHGSHPGIPLFPKKKKLKGCSQYGPLEFTSFPSCSKITCLSLGIFMEG